MVLEFKVRFMETWSMLKLKLALCCRQTILYLYRWLYRGLARARNYYSVIVAAKIIQLKWL